MCKVLGHKFSKKQHLASALVNSRNVLHSVPPFSFGVLGTGWEGKLGWTGEKGGRNAKEEMLFYETAEVSVLYLMFSLVFTGPQLKSIKGAKRIEKSFGITIGAEHDLTGRTLLSGDK